MNEKSFKLFGRLGLVIAMLCGIGSIQLALAGHFGLMSQIVSWAFIFSGAVLFIVIGV